MGFEIVVTKINKIFGQYAVFTDYFKNPFNVLYFESFYSTILLHSDPLWLLKHRQRVNETTVEGLTYSIGREANVNSEEFVVCGCLRYLSAPDGTKQSPAGVCTKHSTIVSIWL